MKHLKNKFKKVLLTANYSLTAAMLVPMTVLADGEEPTNPTNAADALWIKIIDFVGTWMMRGGGVVAVVSIILFFISFAIHDAQMRTGAIWGMIAGAAVFALGGGLSYFLV